MYVTHDQTEALTMGDRIAVLKDGVLQQVGTPRDLYEAPANSFVAGFIGSPAMNLFDADVVDGGVQFGTGTVKVDRDTLLGATGNRVTVGIRPEDLTVSSSGKGLQTTVELVEELGADGYLYGSTEVNGEKIEMVVRVDGRDHPVTGDKIALMPIEHHMHVFDTATGVRLTKEAISAGS